MYMVVPKKFKVVTMSTKVIKAKEPMERWRMVKSSLENSVKLQGHPIKFCSLHKDKMMQYVLLHFFMEGACGGMGVSYNGHGAYKIFYTKKLKNLNINDTIIM